MTEGIDNYPYTSGNGYPADSSDKGVVLRCLRADPDSTRFTSLSLITDVNVVAAGSNLGTPDPAHSYVVAAGRVEVECAGTDSRVVVARGVESQCTATNGRIAAAGGVERERNCAVRCVAPADRVVLK